MSQTELMPAPVPAAPATHRLMLLDTYGLVYRAFFALPALTTTRGVHINAAYGFTMMMNKIIADEKPTHVIAAFDKGLPAARIALYPEYKAQRAETADELRSQFPLVRKILATFAIPIVEIDGEEADDIIATLATQAEAAQQDVLVVTGDLDLLQIVDGRTTVLTTRRGITELGRYDADKVRERYDLEPHQLPDYRGLKGDPSDNLPGIPGVGEKTAIKLVKNAGSLDALIANPKLAGTPKLEALIVQYGEQARVCRDVSVIARDLPLTLDWESARYTQPPNDALYALYKELEFKTLLAKIPPPETPQPVASDEVLEGHYETYTSVTDPPDYARIAARLDDAAARERVAVAVRGDALAVSVDDGTGFAFLTSALASAANVGEAFARLWERVPHLVAYDCKQLIGALGMRVRTIGDDPMIASHLLNPSRTFADVAQGSSEFLDRLLPDDQPAAAADAAGLLARKTREELERRNQLALYEDVELPLAPVLAAMERAGIALDPAALQRDLRGGRRRRRTAAVRDLRARGRRVQPRLTATTRPHPLRQAGVAGGTAKQDRLRDRRRRAARPREELPRRGQSARMARSLQAQEHVRRRAADARRRERPHPHRLQSNVHRHGAPVVDEPELAEHPGAQRARAAHPQSVRRAGRRPRAARGRLLADRVAADGAPVRRRGDAHGVPRSTRTSTTSPRARSSTSDRSRTSTTTSGAWRSRSTSDCCTACRTSGSRSGWRSTARPRAR